MSQEWIPHDYQQWIVDLALEHEALGIFATPGSGKTSITLTCLNEWKQRTLIVAPIRVCQSTWPREIKKWSNFNNIRHTFLHGPDKERQFLRNDVGVYLINPEGLKWLNQAIMRHKRFPWKILVVDESTRFKNPDAKQTNILHKFVKYFDRRYLLSGIPTPNSYLELWSQIFILDKGESLGDNYYRFRHQFANLEHPNSYNWIVHPHSKKEIRERIKPITVYLNAAKHIDLPERVINDIEFDLPKSVRPQYNQMEQELFAVIDDDEVTALSKTAALQKCEQIANGFVYETLTEIQRARKIKPKGIELHKEKIKILESLVEELQGSPLLVAYYFKYDLDMLRKAFPKATFLPSGTPEDEFKKIEKDWNAGNIPLLIGHPNPISHGLNLQESGNNILWYSLTYSYDLFEQFVQRIERQGSKHERVFVHRAIALNTVDEVKRATVERKEDQSESLLNALRQYKKKVQKG